MDKFNYFFGSLLSFLPIANAIYSAYGHGRWKATLQAQDAQQAQINAIALQTPPAQVPVVAAAPAAPVVKPFPQPDPPGTRYILGPDGKSLLRITNETVAANPAS